MCSFSSISLANFFGTVLFHLCTIDHLHFHSDFVECFIPATLRHYLLDEMDAFSMTIHYFMMCHDVQCANNKIVL